MIYTVRPITDWSPFGKKSPKASPFRATWTDTQKLLDVELGHLGARDVVLELDLLAGQIRRDGMPRADAKIGSRAVRLSFQSKQGPLSYATDVFAAAYSGEAEDWQINLRAIALGLKALRQIDRYGIGKGQQYAGYAALPAGSGGAASHMTRHEAENVLLHWGAGDYRRARAATHPDRNGGDRTAWDQVEQAAKLLGLS